MNYETSYDAGARPFTHDKNRGNWESSRDFLYACVGHAFRPEIVIPLLVFYDLGIYALIPYFIILAVCVVPIIFIQSFLGQFSSTGFISAFRIAPLFKGIGYVSLVVNFINLTYFSVLTAIPIFFFIHSLSPTLPWSCEGASQWMDTNKTICFNDTDPDSRKLIPPVEFLRNQFRYSRGSRSGTYFSPEIIIYSTIVWIIATYIILKPTEIIGRFMRYSCLTLIAIMSLCLVRFIFLPGAIDGFSHLIEPFAVRKQKESVLLIPLMVFSTLGPGWGSIISMASYNNFKTDIYRYSWLMSLGQLGVLMGMAISMICLKHFTRTLSLGSAKGSYENWTELLKLPFGLTFLEWPNFWSLLFFAIIGLGSLNQLVLQLFSVLTALFDEFENLREIKRNVILRIVGVLALISMFFCSNHGIFSFEALSKFSALTQIVLNLLLLLVVLWVYGRERFQRDLNFMTSQIYPTWMVFVVRFIAPIFLLFGMMFGMMFTAYMLIFHNDAPSYGIMLILIALPVFLLLWCLIPVYCIIKIKQTAGHIGIRLKRCVRPTDWYPADPVYKQSYEECFSSTDTAHPLSILEEE